MCAYTCCRSQFPSKIFLSVVKIFLKISFKGLSVSIKVNPDYLNNLLTCLPGSAAAAAAAKSLQSCLTL